MRRNKIVATIGPSSQHEEILNRLIGVIDVARLNLKHNSQEWHQNIINKIKKRSGGGNQIKIMVDLPNSDMPVDVEGMDLVALSYIKDAGDVKRARSRAVAKGWDVPLVAKIETRGALTNLDQIISEADAIMVARGDLSTSVNPEEVNMHQKNIIAKARKAAKPVIVATEMLMSMCQNPQPTAAEVADVANAIFDGTDALMLSNETAVGSYPLEAAAMMRRIVETNYQSQYERGLEPGGEGLTDVLIKAAAQIIGSRKIEGVIVFSLSGRSALKLAGYRSGVTTIGISNNQRAISEMSLGAGIEPVLMEVEGSELFDQGSHIFEELKNRGVVDKQGDFLVVHGENWLKSGSISALRLISY